MRKKSMMLLVTLMASVLAMAQNRVISGTISDRETNEAVMQATVQLLKQDSSFVKGTLTDADGAFKLEAPKDGKYIVKLTSVGYITVYKDVTVSKGKNVNLGNMVFKTDAVLLKEATVVGQAAKVTVKEDTFVYNASAFRTPEGSVIEELVKRLPGAQVDESGKITINGKEVKKIKVDGKEFMTGDTKTAMKNLPTSIVERVKAYEEKSDQARMSGIEDGEEEMTLDFGIKAGMNKGFVANNDIGIGTKGRYSARLFDMYTNSDWRVMGMFNANNTNDMGFGGGGGRFGGGRQGLQAMKMGGLNLSYEKTEDFTLSGSIRWNHSDGDSWSKTSAENFVGTNSSFSNSLSQNYSRSNSWNAQFRLEWKPDTVTTIMFRPNISISNNDGLGSSQSATFNKDPYDDDSDIADDPLKHVQDVVKDWDNASSLLSPSSWLSSAVNYRENNSITYSDSKQFNGNFMFNRRLSSNGRNISIRMRGNYSDTDSKNLSSNEVYLFQSKMYNQLIGDSISSYSTNRYNLTPSKRYGYNVRAQYSEPLAKGVYLQFTYGFEYSHNESNRSTYDFSKPNDYFNQLNNDSYVFNGIGKSYRDWTTGLPLNYSELLVTDLSRVSDYDNYNHTAEVGFRVVKKAYQLNVGFQTLPQHNVFHQNYLGKDTTVTRNVVNFSPTARFNYKFSSQHQLRFDYRGTTQQPSMSDLLVITDNTDPLNITEGNPGLKPSFTQSFRLNYNNYIMNHMQSIMSFVDFQTTQNSISNKVTYNQETGGRLSRPENINGNWNVNGLVIYNASVDSAGYFNISTFTNIGYNNHVSYLDMNRQSVKNTVRNTMLGERLGFSYRNSWLEVELNGALNYNHARNELQPNSNLDTWQYSYGGMVDITLPWGTRLNSSMNMNSRRGYNDATMNTNELIWNAQISQSFLRGKPLTLSLQLYDLLHQQSSFSRSISAMSRSDVEYNAITSYAMLHITYNFNAFGGKNARQGQGRGRGGFGGPGGPGGFGGPGGGFGGGRPPRF